MENRVLIFSKQNLIEFIDLTIMEELTHNKTKNENSRIFSTTENKNSIPNAEADIQFWTCKKCGMAEREEDDMWCEHCIKADYKEKDKIIDGLVDVIKRQAKKYNYLSMAYDIEQEIIKNLEQQIDSLKTVAYEEGMGDDL